MHTYQLSLQSSYRFNDTYFVLTYTSSTTELNKTWKGFLNSCKKIIHLSLYLQMMLRN